jgi:hypothetical protein
VKKRGGILEWLARMAEIGRNGQKTKGWKQKSGMGPKKRIFKGKSAYFKLLSKTRFLKKLQKKKKNNFACFSILNLVICARTRESIIYNLLQIIKMNYIF